MCNLLQVIRFSVWDKDPTESELIGQVVEKYNKLDRMPGCSTDVQWYNMYGAPEFKNEKLLSNLKKGAMAVAKAAQQTFGGEVDWAVSFHFISRYLGTKFWSIDCSTIPEAPTVQRCVQSMFQQDILAQF